jgi:ubiquinone/menaquinone biosynthesis C-methylase UbiE
VSLLRDYSNQARTYDDTRGASPSVLGPLREALQGAPGRRLVDLGGGTGNYALALQREGWDVLVVDREPAMLARAKAKGLETLEGQASRSC